MRGFFAPPARMQAKVPNASTDTYATRDPQVGDVWLDFSAVSDGSGSEASPWNTFTSARLLSLRAGQGLWPKGIGAWPDTGSGGASGTSTNRIMVKVWPGASCTFTFGGAGAQTGGGSYWALVGLGLQCIYTGLCTGDNYSFSGGAGRSNYWDFIDCTGTRTASLSPTGDPNKTDNCGIIYCTGNASTGHRVIRGSYVGQTGESNNQSNLWFDYADNLSLIGLKAYQASNPIYLKHTNVNSSGTPGGLVENCYIGFGYSLYGFRAALNWVQYINNVFESCNLSLDEQGGGIQGGNNCILRHNTFLNSNVLSTQEQGSPFPSNNVLTNNALLGTSRLFNQPGSATDANNTSDYTACEGVGTSHFKRNSTSYSLAGYKAAYPTQEAHGVAGTITLVGGATPGSTAANWAMSAGVGKNAASDGTDCGVNASNLLTVN